MVLAAKNSTRASPAWTLFGIVRVWSARLPLSPYAATNSIGLASSVGLMVKVFVPMSPSLSVTVSVTVRSPASP